MADKKVKVVEYQIRGNTVNLEQAAAQAVQSLTALENKLTQLSTAGKKSGGMLRATGISSAVKQINSLKSSINNMEDAVSPEQLNVVATAAETLQKEALKLNRVSVGSTKTFQNLNKQLGEVSKGMHTVAQKSSVLKDALTRTFGITTLLFTLARRLSTLLKDGIKDAISFVEIVNKFNVAAGESATSLGKFANELANIFSMDVSEVLDYVGTFNLLSKSIGATAEEAAQMSKGLTQLTYDLASLFEVDVDTMATAIRSGMTGVSKPLKKYGIVVNEAVLKQKAAMLGITKSWQDMDEVDKMGLRYIVMMEQATAAQGDMAKTLESVANQWRVFKSQITILFRNLGSFVLLVGGQVLPIINGIIKAVNTMISTFVKAAGYVIPDFTNSLSASTTIIDDETDSVDALGKAIKGVLMPFDELNVMSKNTETAGFAFQMDPKIAEALKLYDNLMSQVYTRADQIAKILGSIFDEGMFRGVGAILKEVLSIVNIGLDTTIHLLQMFAPALTWLSKAIGPILEGAAWLLDKVLKPLEWWIEGITSNIWTLIGAFAALNVVQWAVTGSASSMIAVKVGTALAQWASEAVVATYRFLQLTAATIKNKIATLANAAAQWWHNASLAAKIGLLTAGAGLVVVPIALAAAGVFSSKSNEAPKMAKGGVVTDTTIATIGEGRYSEAVIPLGSSPQFAAMKEDIASAVASKIGTGNNSTTSIKLYIGGREFKDFTYELVDEENRKRTGMSLSRMAQKVGV